MIVLYILLGLLGVIVLLLLIAILNTIRIKNMGENKKPLDIPKENLEVYAKEFSKMIQVKTLSYTKEEPHKESYIELQKVMKDLFPNLYKKQKNYYLMICPFYLNGKGHLVTNLWS